MPVVEYGGHQLSVDAALEHVGEFGNGQRIQLLVVGSAWVVAALQTLLTVFAGLDPLRARHVRCAAPEDAACAAALAETYPTVCALPRQSWEWEHPGWSLVSEFDLACGRGWLLHLSNALYFAALIAGCALWQLSGERFGRRRLLYTASLLGGVAGITACTAPLLWMYMLFRVATGVAVGGMGMAAFVLATDPVGPSWRWHVGMLLQLFFSGGACMAALLAWWVRGWRLLTLLCALASLAYTATWPAVLESPQWLLLHGRKGEATAALATLALSNGTRPPEHPLADPTALLANPQRTLRDLLGSGRLRRRLALAGVAWLVAGVAYYGVALLADALCGGQGSGDDSVHIVALIGFAYEVPGAAAAALAVERAGRKPTLLIALLQAATCLVVSAVTRGTAQRALLVAARFGLAAAFAALYLHTAELFPLVVRQQGLAAANYCARAGAVLAPALAFAQSQLRSGFFVPLLVLGALCLLGVGAAALLPDTLGVPAVETVQDFNLVGRRKRTWRIALQGDARAPLPQEAALYTPHETPRTV